MHYLSLLRIPGRLAARLLILAAPLLLTGCDLNFWRMDGRQSTIVVEGPVAQSQLDVFYVTCWVTLVIFVLVGAVLAYATIKFRARNEADEHAEPPPQGHGNPLVEVSLIAASVFSLVIIAIPTLKGIWYTYDVPEADKANTYHITATGYQWWFKFEYNDEQIAGRGAMQTSNELVIPAGKPVHIEVRTTDVIHSFWVPKLGGKVDMMPNRGNFLWIEADKPGYYWGQCAEYCGDSHAVMRFRVVALAPAEYATWLENQKKTARVIPGVARINATTRDPAQNNTTAAERYLQANPLPANVQLASFKRNEYGYSAKWAADVTDVLANWKAQQIVPTTGEDALKIQQGRVLFSTKTCNSCHAVTGHEGVGVSGPNLTHVGARTTIAAGLLENTPEQLARWLTNPEAVKPGNKMAVGFIANKITLSPAEVQALVAYLSSLK